MAEAKRDRGQGGLSREGRLRCSLSGPPEDVDGASVKDTGADEAGGAADSAARMRKPRHQGRHSDEVAQGVAPHLNLWRLRGHNCHLPAVRGKGVQAPEGHGSCVALRITRGFRGPSSHRLMHTDAIGEGWSPELGLHWRFSM